MKWFHELWRVCTGQVGAKWSTPARQQSRICGDRSLQAPGLPVMASGWPERWRTGPPSDGVTRRWRTEPSLMGWVGRWHAETSLMGWLERWRTGSPWWWGDRWRIGPSWVPYFILIFASVKIKDESELQQGIWQNTGWIHAVWKLWTIAFNFRVTLPLFPLFMTKPSGCGSDIFG